MEATCLLSLDDSGKQPSRRLLYLGTCWNANSHNSAYAVAGTVIWYVRLGAAVQDIQPTKCYRFDASWGRVRDSEHSVAAMDSEMTCPLFERSCDGKLVAELRHRRDGHRTPRWPSSRRIASADFQ